MGSIRVCSRAQDAETQSHSAGHHSRQADEPVWLIVSEPLFASQSRCFIGSVTFVLLVESGLDEPLENRIVLVHPSSIPSYFVHPGSVVQYAGSHQSSCQLSYIPSASSASIGTDNLLVCSSWRPSHRLA